MKTGRNNPCPCGSGKKYKHCCGASGGSGEASESIGGIPRQCGECTGCCDGWVKINIYGHKVYPGKPCPFSTGHSCRIYERRPKEPCQEFFCGWLSKDSFLPEWFRPDKAGCIVLPAKLVWRGLPVDVIVPVGKRIKPKSLAWLKRYASTHMRLLIYSGGDELWSAYGPPEFQQEIADRHRRGEVFW